LQPVCSLGTGGRHGSPFPVRPRTDSTAVKCQAKGVPNGTGTAVNYDYASTGISCGVLSSNRFFVTQDWHETVCASGNATLTCRYKNP
jgi:hypothetical protein